MLLKLIKRIRMRIIRNRISLNAERVSNKRVYLEWWSRKQNVGDSLAPIIYQWMLERKGIDPTRKTKKATHLMAVGSILGMGCFDAVVWGSGIHCESTARNVVTQSVYRKYDIRSVRGPITRMLLTTAGYSCPERYGDPAVLMPMIYEVGVQQKRYQISVILHLSRIENKMERGLHYIDVRTEDYRCFITQILQSERVISSSLHGIILAEAYGVPAVFLNDEMDNEIWKFFDWYYSTGRTNVRFARSIQEAIHMEPMELPDLEVMQKETLQSFPYDLWMK